MRHNLPLLLVPFSIMLLTTAARADCAEEIAQAFTAMNAAVPYRSEMLSKGSVGAVRTISEVDTPAGLRTRTEGSETIETVILGDRAWRNRGQGWEELPADQAKAIATQVRASADKPATMFENAKCAGSETRSGRALKVYEYEQSFKVGDDVGKSEIRFLVDAQSALPAFMEVTSTALGMMSLSLVTITYDKSIKIEPPKIEAKP